MATKVLFGVAESAREPSMRRDCTAARSYYTVRSGPTPKALRRSMTPEEAIREAKAKELRPIYLVAGEERYLASEVVQALRDATLDGAIPGLNDETLTAGEASVDSAIDAARTLPMMARRRWVLVRNIERWEGRE